jgi:hypothetical protein
MSDKPRECKECEPERNYQCQYHTGWDDALDVHNVDELQAKVEAEREKHKYWRAKYSEESGKLDQANENIKGKLLIDPDDVVEVRCVSSPDFYARSGTWFEDAEKSNCNTKALLIKSSIEPIEKDSLEKLFKDFVIEGNCVGASWPNSVCKLHERAKRLLGEGEL